MGYAPRLRPVSVHRAEQGLYRITKYGSGIRYPLARAQFAESQQQPTFQTGTQSPIEAALFLHIGQTISVFCRS